MDFKLEDKEVLGNARQALASLHGKALGLAAHGNDRWLAEALDGDHAEIGKALDVLEGVLSDRAAADQRAGD